MPNVDSNVLPQKLQQDLLYLNHTDTCGSNEQDTALLPIIAGYQLSPDRIKVDITSPK